MSANESRPVQTRAANESKSRFPKHTKLGPEMEAAIEYTFDPRGSEVD